MTVSRQEEFLATGRRNQKQRTREAIVESAIRLARAGRSPSIAEVAKDARVSNATAYRYFPNLESLWADVAARAGIRIQDIVAELPDDTEQRIELVIRKIAENQFADEGLWRALLRASHDRWFQQAEVPEGERVPVRGTSRLDGTRAALAPLARELSPELFHRLTMAVMLVWGAEAMVVTRDSCGLAPDEATDVMSWAARALIRAALAEADGAPAAQSEGAR
jgi:AcrR family transcriptional regulator